MLHTQPAGSGDANVGAVPTWVQCRSRLWKVLDVGDVDATRQWRLSRGSELARTLAAPPDVVTAVPTRRRIVSRAAWVRGVLHEIAATTPIWWPASASQLPITPAAYQYVPAMAMLSGHHRRILVADDVGMGKTVQAAILLHEIHGREPDASSIVVVPAALVPQWTRELRARASIDPVILDATALRREAVPPRAVVEASRAGTCCLISIDLLRQPEVSALLARTRWTVMVLDEAHHAAPGTARLQAVSRVASVSVRLLLLTATPHAAGPSGADTLRAIGRTAGERPMLVLCRRGALLDRPRRRTHQLTARLSPDHADLCARLDDFAARARRDTGAHGLLPALVLRRRASSCPAALVHSLERRLQILQTAVAGPQQISLFEDAPDTDRDAEDDRLMALRAWLDEAAEREALEGLLTFARRLPPGGAKLRAVARLLRRCREPAVVFTAYVDTLRALRAALPGHRIVIVHGRQPDALRAQAIDAFTSGEADILLTTDASAEGVNLHARCRLVVHAEVPLSARVFLQRTGRVDRYGQSSRVHAFIVCSDSRDDDEALQRLHRRTGEEERWTTAVSGRACARTAFAARQMARHGGGGSRSARLRRGDSDDEQVMAPHVQARVVGRRAWMRMAARADWPANASAIWVGALRCGAWPLLSACRTPVALVVGGGVSAAAVAASAADPATWRRLLPRVLDRAQRLARRLAAWESAAALRGAREGTAQAHPAGLFDDAGGREVGPQGPPVQGEPMIHASFELRSVLERRQ